MSWTAVQQLMAAVSRQRESSSAGHVAARGVLGLLGGERVTVWRLVRPLLRPELVAAFDQGGQAHQAEPPHLDDPDAEALLAGDRPWIRREDALLAALDGPEGVFGLVAVERSTPPPTDEEAAILAVIAGTLAQALRLAAVPPSSRELADGLRTVAAMADELFCCDDLDTLFRRAVELARERLGLERCSIFVEDGDGKMMRGTWGTDIHGRTTDERQVRTPLKWRRPLSLRRPEEPRFAVHWEPYSEWHNGQLKLVGEGWVATTPIQSRARPIGLFCNDSAISGAPPEPLRQELLGLFASIVGSLADRLTAELALATSEGRLKAVLAHAPLVLFGLDAEGRLNLLTGINPDELGMSADAIGRVGIPEIEPYVPELARDLARALNGESFTAAVDYNGRYYHCAYTPMFAPDGSVEGVIGVATDITDRRQSEVELLAAKQTAESADQAKAVFLANMGHELLTPLNSIVGMTELCLEGPLTDEQRHYLETAHASAGWLRSLLADVLELSSLETGAPALVPAPFVLRDCLGETVLALAPKAQEQGLELLIRVEPGVPDALVGDARRIRQVVANLIGNAIKFTAAGHILLRAAVGEVTAERAEVRLTVEDTGVGIDPEQRAIIFEPFVCGTGSRQQGGTGLGLAIVRRLVERMEGGIELASEPGEGTRFSVTLPLARQPGIDGTGLPPAPPELAGRTALLVGGSRAMADVLTELLADWGITALDTPGERAPVAIVANLTEPLPAELARLKALAARYPNAALILLHPVGLQGPDLPGAVRLLKPVRQAQLLEALRRGPAQPAAPPPGTPRCGRILVVEDHEASRELAGLMLERRGHRPVLAPTPADALAAAADGGFDLVLLDVQLPGMDGFELAARLRALDTAHSPAPIVALTARAMTGDRERCLAGGFDEYLAKPYRAHDLYDLVDRLLGRDG